MQLRELRAFAVARGWTVTGEYVDRGVSGSKERRGTSAPLVYGDVVTNEMQEAHSKVVQMALPVEAKLICE
jgi:DNA invertase Pin-like site-specific DNA recombinase